MNRERIGMLIWKSRHTEGPEYKPASRIRKTIMGRELFCPSTQ